MEKTLLKFFARSNGTIVSTETPNINQYANNIDVYMAVDLPPNSIVQLIIRPSTFTDQTLPARYMTYVDETIVVNGITIRGVYKYSMSQEDTSIAPQPTNTMHFAFNFYDNESQLIATVAELPITIKKTNAVRTEITPISATDTLSSAVNKLSSDLSNKSDIYYTEKVISINDSIAHNSYYVNFTPNSNEYNSIAFSGGNSIVVSLLNTYLTIYWTHSGTTIFSKTVVNDYNPIKLPLTYFENYETLTVSSPNEAFKWLIPHDCEQNYKDIQDIIDGDTTVGEATNASKLNNKNESELDVNSAEYDKLGNKIDTTYSTTADLTTHNDSQNAHIYIQGLITDETNNRLVSDGNLYLQNQSERADRISADNSLQAQITAINNRSDVVDIVTNKQALIAYDKTNLTINDKIKVLEDIIVLTEPLKASTYYKWLGTNTGTISDWQYIGYDVQQTNVLVADVKQNIVEFDSAPQDQLDNRYTKDETDTLFINNYGKEVQLDFNATLNGNDILATLDSSIANYELVSGTSYLIHIHLPLTTLTGDLNNAYNIYLVDKNNNNININCVFQKNISATSNVGDLCQIQDYNVTDGYSWEFNGYYKEIGANKFVYTDIIVRESNPAMTGTDIHNAIANSSLKVGTTVLCTEDYSTTLKKGTTYKITGEWLDGELIIDTQAVHDFYKQDKPTVATSVISYDRVMISNNVEYYFGEIPTLILQILLDNIGDSCFLSFDSGSPATSITYHLGNPIFIGTDCLENDFIPVANKHYEILFIYEGVNKIYARVNGWEIE